MLVECDSLLITHSLVQLEASKGSVALLLAHCQHLPAHTSCYSFPKLWSFLCAGPRVGIYLDKYQFAEEMDFWTHPGWTFWNGAIELDQEQYTADEAVAEVKDMLQMVRQEIALRAQ